MQQLKHHNEVMPPILQASSLVLISTIFNIIYFKNLSSELSLSFVIGLSSVALFSVINPLILFFQKQFKLYLYTSLILFICGIIHVNYFAIGSYSKTLTIIPIDLHYTTLLFLLIYLSLSALALLIKKIKLKRSDLKLPNIQLENKQALS